MLTYFQIFLQFKLILYYWKFTKYILWVLDLCLIFEFKQKREKYVSQELHDLLLHKLSWIPIK